jgi:hypothetical protein
MNQPVKLRSYLDRNCGLDLDDMSVWEKITLEEAEGPPILIRETGEMKPWGYCNDEWEAFQRIMRPGDELYRYRTSNESWAHLAGRAGIALVRNGEIIKASINEMN